MRGIGFETLGIVRHVSIAAIPTMFGLTRLPARRKAHMQEPHWYLATLGVDPTSQGQGQGTLLVREGLDRADSDGVEAYLETETEANVRFYERFGFGVVEEIASKRLEGPIWLMARLPR